MRLWNAAGIAIVLCTTTATAADRQVSTDSASVVGAWTLNAEASDSSRDRHDEGDKPRSRRGDGGGGGGYGRGRGMGRGGGRGGAGGGFGTRDSDETRRRMQAMRDMMTPADHLTITRTDSLIIVTAGDGRTTRLSADGKKIKDESTGLERKTTWENGNLVSEITGGPGKVIETYAVDAEHGQLTVTLRFEGGRQPNGRVVRHVYDREQTH
jgi:hypothetical protein